jgi:hypothetical protein
VHSSGKDNAASASLGNGRRAVGNVEAVTRAGVLVENGIAIFADGERFASKKSLVGFKVECFDDTACELVTCELV